MRTILADGEGARATFTVTDAQIDQAAAVHPGQLASALPNELAEIVQAALDIIARGGTVTIGAIPKELTTTAAAEMLDVSRPTLMKLLKEGALPSHKVGSHTRVRAHDVIAYRERKRGEQRTALADLRAFEDEISRDMH